MAPTGSPRSWITTLAHRRDRERERTRLFERELNELWASLKDRLEASCDAYERLYPHGQAGILAQYEGADPEAPVVRRMTRNPADQQFTLEKCRVTVSRNGAVHRANYSTTRRELRLTVGQADDGHAVAQHDSADISLDRVCELILRPILFDDLPDDS